MDTVVAEGQLGEGRRRRRRYPQYFYSYLLAFYSRYLRRCNKHRFDELGEFVAEDVNGPTEGLSRYIAGLRAVVQAFSDYQCELQRLLVDDQWLAARLYGAGTHTGPFRGIAATGAGHLHAGAGDLSNSPRQDR